MNFYYSGLILIDWLIDYVCLKSNKMKQFLTTFLTFLGLFSYAQVYQLEEAKKYISDTESLNLGLEYAEMVREGLLEENYEEFLSNCTDQLTTKLNSSMLKGLMDQMTEQYGEATSSREKGIKITAENTFYLSEIMFGEASFDVEIALDQDSKISSLMLKPATFKGEWVPADYAANTYNSEQFILKNTGLRAEIISPEGESKTAIVVMVHGSGPNDMDGSLGPNKFFKDIALGLAKVGIASLRYNKRTYDFPSASAQKANEFTIDDIVTNDAVSALKHANDLGYEKVILLGHSLGGHLAPKIAEQSKVSGVVVMAGNSSPMIDLLVPQYEYLMKNDPNSQITEFMLNAISAQVDLVKSKEYDSSTPLMMLPLGLPPSFWRSLEKYSAVEVARKQKNTPYLILNGERDYQVTTAEAEGWKSGNKNPLSKTIIYPGANHLFYKGEGVLIPSEYDIKSHVSEEVVIDIMKWINSL